jgi:hypothetical protein
MDGEAQIPVTKSCDSDYEHPRQRNPSYYFGTGGKGSAEGLLCYVDFTYCILLIKLWYVIKMITNSI